MSPTSIGSPNDKCPRFPSQNCTFGIFGNIAHFMGSRYQNFDPFDLQILNLVKKSPKKLESWGNNFGGEIRPLTWHSDDPGHTYDTHVPIYYNWSRDFFSPIARSHSFLPRKWKFGELGLLPTLSWTFSGFFKIRPLSVFPDVQKSKNGRQK